MSNTEAVSALASVLIDLRAEVQANSLLLRILFAERAINRGYDPEQAQDEIEQVIASLDHAARHGHEGEEREIDLIAEALRGFGEALRNRIEMRTIG